MFVKVINPKTHGKTEYNNSGSCAALVNYLSKEDKDKGLERELYFNHDKDQISSIEVTRSIDNNCPNIEQNEAKFYSLVIAPEPDEMQHLKSDPNRLKEYVRDTMDIYAQNFNKKDGTSKNLSGNDLVYYAKMEHNRYYKGTDEEVKKGHAKQGEALPGDNTHIHIIVSRKDKSKEIKLSPLVNSKKLFSRENFKTKCCNHFDKKYKYEGSGKELEKHLLMRDGTVEQKIAYITKEYEQRKAQRDKEESQTKEEKTDISKLQTPKQKPDNEKGYGIGL
jgi:hypothetical protein